LELIVSLQENSYYLYYFAVFPEKCSKAWNRRSRPEFGKMDYPEILVEPLAGASPALL